MAATAAYQGLLKIGSNTVAEVVEVDADFENQMEEVTVMGTRGRQYLPTVYKGSIKAKLNYNLGDTNGQKAIQDAWLAGTSLSMSYSPSNGATNTTYSFTVFVSKMSIKGSVDKVITNDVELQPSGAFTIA